MGSVMQVEPSTATKKRRSNRILIRRVPTHVLEEDIQRLVGTFGTVQKCDIATSNLDTSVSVIYESPDQAQQAVDQLNDYEYQGSVLKVDYINAGGRSQRGGPSGRGFQGRMGGYGSSNGSGARGTGLPLRILVPSDFVGAIIGRQGQTIRNITTQSRARVDVHRDDAYSNSGPPEKVISIYGQPENCTNACKEILKVMQTEAQTNSQGGGAYMNGGSIQQSPNKAYGDTQEVILKLLADDRYCGRIIGKEGKVIKKIREDTDTKITVSKNYSFAYHSVQEMPAIFPDRVITIRGNVDGMSAAEGQISSKLRECYEKEPPRMMLPPQMMPSFMPQMYNQRATSGYAASVPPAEGRFGGNTTPGTPTPQAAQDSQQAQAIQTANEVCQISVPNASVGAIIGTGGTNIKQMIRDSNAFVTIEAKKDDDVSPSADRIVTIKGVPDAQWRASYFVFEKLKQEGYAGNEEVRLRTALKVPRVTVGRVIGKGGKNVRDIQRMTGAMIKLPEDPQQQGEETIVEIFGNFMATQSAMSRVRALVTQSADPRAVAPLMGGGTPGRTSRGAPHTPVI